MLSPRSISLSVESSNKLSQAQLIEMIKFKGPKGILTFDELMVFWGIEDTEENRKYLNDKIARKEIPYTKPFGKQKFFPIQLIVNFMWLNPVLAKNQNENDISIEGGKFFLSQKGLKAS